MDGNNQQSASMLSERMLMHLIIISIRSGKLIMYRRLLELWGETRSQKKEKKMLNKLNNKKNKQLQEQRDWEKEDLSQLLDACQECTNQTLVIQVLEWMAQETKAYGTYSQPTVSTTTQHAPTTSKVESLPLHSMCVQALQQLFVTSCIRGRKEVSKRWIELFGNLKKIKIHIKNCYLSTPSLAKSKKNNKKKFKNDSCKRNLLHWCSLHNDSDTLLYLLQLPPSTTSTTPTMALIDSGDAAGYTPLTYARGLGSSECTNLLLQFSASSMKRGTPVVSLWRHITYTTERPKTNLRDELYVGVKFSLGKILFCFIFIFILMLIYTYTTMVNIVV